MMEEIKANQKPVGTREWYDFIGRMGNILPPIHLGGPEATRALLDMCQLDATSRVLDVGCGAGHTACLIAEQYGAHVQGIDLSEVMVAQANERARQQGVTDRVEFRVADVCQMPFGAESFDVVVFESVLTPLPGDKHQALSEMVRVLRPGGRVGANEGTLKPGAPPELLALFDEHPAIYRYFTPETLRSLFEATGLQVVQMTDIKVTEAPGLQGMGLRSILSFMIRSYPRFVLTLLRDARFRKAQRIDEQVTSGLKQYMSCTLIVGQKPDHDV
ncbi:MAG: methyltransferase domain-containing protein [Chloroflexi bacterium]|nr:methyltransferase domain-containing protein [Chloroflexota bacterium]MBU1750701.1 methyltransferase domain-containing protein [Chloroflexota bacterium]MBU1879797.1 methyltransferase domain-containing protein [Chloroflexota bacterium]